MQRLPSYAVFFVCSREGSLHERPVSGYQKAGLTTGTIRPARAQRVFGASPVVRAWPGEEAWPGDKVAVTVRYDTTDNNPLLTGLELGKGTLLTEIHAYPGHRGSVRMAVGDVTGNGRADIVTVPSRGVAEVRVFENHGSDAAEWFRPDPWRQFAAFDTSFIGGATVAVGDLLGSGNNQIVVGSGSGMRATVNVFDPTQLGQNENAATPVRQFFPFDDEMRGGVDVTVGRVRPGYFPG